MGKSHESPGSFTEEEKLNIANEAIRGSGGYEVGKKIEKLLEKKEGPEDALKEGKGFITKPSDGSLESNEHPVEFRPGASNVDEVETEEKKE